MSEIEPIFSPLISLPNAHAPSSKRGIFFEEHIFFISSRPLGFPKVSTKITADRPLSIFFLNPRETY